MTQARIDTFAGLVGLLEYWTREMNDLAQHVQDEFVAHCEHLGINAPTRAELDKYLLYRFEIESTAGVGRKSLGLLTHAYLDHAVRKVPSVYQDFVDLLARLAHYPL